MFHFERILSLEWVLVYRSNHLKSILMNIVDVVLFI